MGLNVIRKDSVKEKQKEKTRKQLQEENEQLRAKVESLEGQLTDTQMALCDVYELLDTGLGKCRMCVAAPADYKDDPSRPVRWPPNRQHCKELLRIHGTGHRYHQAERLH